MKFITSMVVMLLQVSPAVAQPVRVTGTSVALAPPVGFVPSARFPGFERADLQSSLMVTEIPGPVAEVSRGMTATSLATRGMPLMSSTRQLVDGRQALLLKVSQLAAGMTVHKWMIVSGEASTTVMIVATFPKEHEPQIGDAAKDSLLTVRWTVGAASPDHFEGLPFRISSTTSLKIAGRMSNMLMLTESGQMSPQGPTAALFVVGASLVPVDLSDLKAFATTRASQTKQLQSLRLSEQGTTAIGDETAYELVAQGTDITTGRLVTLYQVVLPDPQGYILMQGMVATTRRDDGAGVPESGANVPQNVAITRGGCRPRTLGRTAPSLSPININPTIHQTVDSPSGNLPIRDLNMRRRFCTPFWRLDHVAHVVCKPIPQRAGCHVHCHGEHGSSERRCRDRLR